MRKELEEVLIKKASQIKAAGPKGEIGSMFAWNLLPYIGGAGNAIGGAAGSMDTPSSEKEEKEWDENPAYGLGTGAYRANRRLKRQLINDKGRAPHYISQSFGTGTSLLASILAGGIGGAAIGGGLGAGLGFDGNRVRSAGIGAGMGATTGGMIGGGLGLLATLGAGPLAAMTKRRTKEEQKAYANSPALKEYLIPGLAQYNMWKSVGRAVGDSEERETKGKEGEKKTAAASFGAIPAIGNALSPAPAPATVAKPQQQAATAQNQQQQAQNQSGEHAPQADTNTIADLTASLNKITDVAKNSIKPSEQNTVAQGGETAQAEAVSGALKAASAKYTKVASDRKKAIIYGIINKVMK